jgi:hypothetical protein
MFYFKPQYNLVWVRIAVAWLALFPTEIVWVEAAFAHGLMSDG